MCCWGCLLLGCALRPENGWRMPALTPFALVMVDARHALLLQLSHARPESCKHVSCAVNVNNAPLMRVVVIVIPCNIVILTHGRHRALHACLPGQTAGDQQVEGDACKVALSSKRGAAAAA